MLLDRFLRGDRVNTNPDKVFPTNPMTMMEGVPMLFIALMILSNGSPPCGVGVVSVTPSRDEFNEKDIVDILLVIVSVLSVI